MTTILETAIWILAFIGAFVFLNAIWTIFRKEERHHGRRSNNL